MTRTIIALITFIAITDCVYAATDSALEQWECAVNLHQGDTGTLSLERSGNNVDGVILVNRSSTTFESQVSGTWLDSEINIKRLLDTNSSEPMSGLVINLGTEKIKIGGRFSDEYQGVWSADCDLVSGPITAQEGASNEGGDGSVESKLSPSSTSRVSPNNPNDKERITFSALATHPDGIESISLFLGKNEIHTCNSSKCEIEYGPVSAGNYKWRVEAMSKSGVKSTDFINDLVVRDSAITDKCTISGFATGEYADQSAFYLVNLLGPNNAEQFREAAGFVGGSYVFSNLPAGSYLLTIDTQADQGVLSSPSSMTLNCQSNSKLTQNFSFN